MSNAEIRGLFVWHELMTTDPQSAAAFYAGVFRWKAQPSSVPGYTLWMSGEVGVGGLMAQPEETRMAGMPPSWLAYLGTPDVDATVQAAQRLGGRVVKDAVDIPAVGRFAVLADPQGAVFAVFTPAAPPPKDAAASGVISQFSWHELATSDPQGALDFYSALFGWNGGEAHDMGAGNLYQIIEREGAAIGGIHRLQDPSMPPYWLAYVKVDDLDASVASVRAASGQIVQEPREVRGGDRVARILDPQGGVIALHERLTASASQAGKVARRPAAGKRSGPRTVKRPPTRAAGSKAAPRPKAKAKAKTARSNAPVRKTAAKRPTAKAPARKTAAKRPTAKAPVRRNVKLKKAVRAGSGGRAARKRKVARRR